MKVNFKQILVEVTFGEYKELDIAKKVGNFIHVNTNDISLDDVARAIYYSEGEIEIDNDSATMIAMLIEDRNCTFLAGVKKAILKQLKTE
jgi:hypothetical protein